MWLTVLMTAECYIHVFFPSRSKSICTKRNLSRSYVVIVASGMILASIYILNRTVQLEKHCDTFVVKILASETFLMKLSERVHTIANLLLAIMIPLFLLVFMTAAIVWRLLIRASDVGATSRFSAEKKCVTRITLITTVLQLITETPTVPVFIYAALFGPNIVNKNAQLCNWQTVSHFLGLCNASMSFFVYISFSERFRTSMLRRAQLMFHECCPTLISRPVNITKMRTYTSFMSHTGANERSFESSTLRRPEMLSFSSPANFGAENGSRAQMQIVINSGSGSQLADMSRQVLSPCTTPTSVHDSFL
uniref:G-protein coupled receptors family 1 profile domain-containing protein n=1 Tax=Panagrolaimus sp. JU765 TaxID=591449 RepID=A0AC34Q2I6_9BILA